jgi:hypothetical protein
MPTRGYFWLSLALSSALLFPSASSADTIRITSGFVELGGPFDLRGDQRGFRLFGGGYNGGSGPNLFVFCPGDICNPGEVAAIRHAATGLDLPARAMLDGITHEDVNSLNATLFAGIGFESTHVLPPISSMVILRAPFTMEGSFSLAEQSPGFETLVGQGTVTTTWRPDASDDTGAPAWMLTAARYEFFGASPIPEPSTLVLAGIAGAAAALRRRKRRAR